MGTPEWNVEVLPEADRDLRNLPDIVRAEAIEIIRDLAEDPFPPEAMPLRRHKNRYKIKFHNYRVVAQSHYQLSIPVDL